jgi:DNA-binding MarR family transcriptional regulator
MATKTYRADESHGRAVMGLIHRITAGGRARPTLELNVRHRFVLQALGLEGSRPIAAIGQQLGLGPSTMTGLVDRLEEQGLVRRVRHARDRRATVLRLTRKGEATFRREVDFYRALLDGMLEATDDAAKPLILDAVAHLGGARRTAAALAVA